MSVPESSGRPAYRLYQWVWDGLDLLYPPQCGGCGKPGTRWCQTCLENTEVIFAPVCPRCGQAQEQVAVCYACQSSAPSYTALRSWAVFGGPVREALHRLKYGGDIGLGEIFARPLLQMWFDLEWEVDLVTPVPLGVARQAQRGYNQAALIAWPLAVAKGTAYRSNALHKALETRSQVGLSAVERRQNVVGAFRAQTRVVAGKRVLVIDDVTTSGATLDACSHALLAAGAREVYGLTLARASLHTHTSAPRSPVQPAATGVAT